MRNQDVRQAMQQDKLPLWRVAETLGVHENTLRRWLQAENIDTDRRQRILRAVQAAKDKRNAEGRREHG